MASIPGDLIWEIVKKNNSFLVKQFGNSTAMVQFSKERNNLYNVNSFKYSGLANKKTVLIQPAGKDLSVVLATTKTKKQNRPATLYHRSVMKKEFRQMAKAVVNQVLKLLAWRCMSICVEMTMDGIANLSRAYAWVSDNYYRPDLKNSSLARLSAVRRSLQVAKSGVKKRNRQAVKAPRK